MTSTIAPHPGPATGAIPVAHEHGWTTESRHTTSEGAIVYVRCAVCGLRRVDRINARSLLPRAISVAI